LVLCVPFSFTSLMLFVTLTCTFDHCIVNLLIYNFELPLWCLQTFFGDSNLCV
jgi:hypothetical protein